MSSPLVSIVVLNYNYARFLPRSVSSVLGQDYPNKEIIIVDDASTDHSAEVIAGFEGAVIPVLQAENKGQGAAMNAGFKASKGELVFFLDADDHLYPHAVSKVVAA